MKTRLITIILSLIILMSITSCSPENSSNPSQKIPANSVPVVYGEVKAHKSWEISMDFPAAVKDVSINEGRVLQSGELIMSLDISSFRAQIASKEKELGAARGRLKQITDSENLEALELAKKSWQLNQALYETGGLSEHEMEINKVEYLIKEKEELNRQNSASLAQIQIEAIELELADMKRRLNKPFLYNDHVVAPVDNAIVAYLGCNSGTSLSGTEGPIIKLFEGDSIYIQADIPEESISSYAIGDKMEIRLADSNHSATMITGIITVFSAQAIIKDSDVIVPAEIEVTSGKEYLKPGLSVDIYTISD